MRLRVRRVGLASLGKFGCLLGVVAACAPSLLCGLLALAAVNVLRRWLEGWEGVSISILGQEITRLDFVRLLGLTELLDRLQAVGGLSWAVLAAIVLLLALAAGALLGAIVMLVGLVYNLLAATTGGLEVDAAVVEEPA